MGELFWKSSPISFVSQSLDQEVNTPAYFKDRPARCPGAGLLSKMIDEMK